MATVSQSLKLNDGVSPVLDNMQQSMNKVLVAFAKMQQATNQNMDMAEMQVARENLHEVGVAIRVAQEEQARLNATMRQMKSPEVDMPALNPNAMPRAPTPLTPPDPLPKAPSTDRQSIHMPQVVIPEVNAPPITLTVEGYEESKNKIVDMGTNLDKLVEKQGLLAKKAELMDFIPDNTQSEILKVENGLSNLKSSLDRITEHHKKLNGVMSKSENDKALQGMQELERNLLSTVAQQERLNAAMESGDLRGMNRSAKELESNIASLEKQAMALGKQYEKFNSNLLLPSTAIPNMPQMPTMQVPSVNVPKVSMPALDMQTTGYEAALEKVRFINSGLEKIVTTQDKVNRQAQVLDFIPSATQSKIQKADTSIKELVKSLQSAQARQEGLNTSMNRAESAKAIKSISRLESGIARSIRSQERLNAAMESGDLKSINRAANELTRNINRAERESQKLNRSQDEHNRSLDTANRKANSLLGTFRNLVGAYAGFAAAKGMFDGGLGLDKMERTFQARLGDKDAGSALFEKLQKQAQDSAFSLDELAKNTASFLSMTTNPKQIDGLNSLAEKLAMFDTTGQGLAGAGFSIKEAMSGDIVSLAERFNMSKSLIRGLGIDDLGKAGDIEGFITQFEKLLDMQNMGQDAYDELLKAPEVQLNMLKSNFKTAFSEAATTSIQALQPLFDRLNAFMASDSFNVFLTNLSIGLTYLANGAIWAWDGLSQLWGVLTNVYAAIEPYAGVIFGVVAAFAAFYAIVALTNGVLAIAAGIKTVVAFATAVLAAAQALQTGATFAATMAQHGLNAALLACPITWIVILVVGLIATLVYLWKTNDQVAAALMRAWNMVLNSIERIGIGFIQVFYGVLDFMGSFRVGFLSILEGAINGAIGMINDFIGLLNNIPGVSIDVIGQVSFAAGAQAEEEAKKQSRADDIDSKLASYNENVARREQNVQDMLADRELKRQEKADKKANRASNSTQAWDNFSGEQIDMGNIDEVGKVGKIDEPVEWDDEDLKLLREIAEMTAVQNFVTLKPEIQVTTGDINNDVDIEQVVKRIEENIEVEVAAHAKEVYNLG